MLVTVGWIASVVLVLAAISVLQRERARAREEQRQQNGRLRGLWIAVIFVGLVALLYFTIQR